MKEELKKFIEKNGRNPKGSVREEYRLYNWMRAHKNDPEVKELVGESKIDHLGKLEKFIEEHGRAPKYSIKEEANLYNWMIRNIKTIQK